MALPNDHYWEVRAMQRMASVERSATPYLQNIQTLYARAAAQITADIEQMLSTYSKNGALTREEALELLNKPYTQGEIAALRMRYYNEPDEEVKKRLLAELNAPAYQARINRLEMIALRARQDLLRVAPQQIEETTTALINAGQTMFTRTVYDIQSGTGLAYDFSQARAQDVETILKRKWSGEHYSKRIWTNTETVAARIPEIVKQNALTGRSWRRCIEELEDQVTYGGRKTAERVLRTESAYVANEMEAEAYEDAGVDEYLFVATLDGRTSEICQEHDGKRYKLSDRKPGSNYPPLHPHCRSTTIAGIDDKVLAGLERRARDPVTGKTYKVPAGTTYKQWLEGLDPAQRKEYDLQRKMTSNRSSDRKQLDRYKIAGIKNLPRSLSKFQTIKYSDPDKYVGLKKKYATIRAFDADSISTSDEATRYMKTYANKEIKEQVQNRHIRGTEEFIEGRSELLADPKDLVSRFAGTGTPLFSIKKGTGKPYWTHKELVDAGEYVGYDVPIHGVTEMTTRFTIRYSKDGVHVVPTHPAKGESK